MDLKTLQFSVESINIREAYPFKWRHKDEFGGEATFDAKGRTIIVTIETIPRSDHEYEVTFGYSKGGNFYGLTGDGDAFKVLASVIAAAIDYAKDYLYLMKSIRIVAEKSPGAKRSGDSGRQKVYERLFKKFTPPIGNWKKKIENEGWRTVFTYERID